MNQIYLCRQYISLYFAADGQLNASADSLGSCSYLSQSSCTLFSPNTFAPASMASRYHFHWFGFADGNQSRLQTGLFLHVHMLHYTFAIYFPVIFCYHLCDHSLINNLDLHLLHCHSGQYGHKRSDRNWFLLPPSVYSSFCARMLI